MNGGVSEFCRKCSELIAGFCRLSGSEFQTVGSATEKAWVSNVLRQTRGTDSKAMFTLILVRVRVPSAGFSLLLAQASPIRVSVHGHLYKDNSMRVYRQSPEKSNRENALRKSNNIPLNR